jgi:hypothetical protein
MLLIYLAFLGFQQHLYTSNSLEQVVPWASFESHIGILRMLVKIVIAIGFTFDKAGYYRWQINIACFAIQGYVVIKRLTNGLIFNTSVFYATLVYEALALWLYGTVALHIISDTSFTVVSLSLLILTGLCIGGILVLLQNWRKKKCMETEHTDRFEAPFEYMMYFFRLYKLIESQKAEANLIL